MIIEMGAATDVGRVRQINEDSYLAQDQLAVVADGMGGHACGDRASSRAIDRFRALLGHGPVQADQVHAAVAAANDAILADAAASAERRGMGTTLTGLVLVEQDGAPHWLVFNLGDSRVYRITSAHPVQLTVDHSEIAELVAAGRISHAEARHHPLRSVVTRSLGVEQPGPADAWLFPPDAAGDVFLVCSDGLTNELTDDRIGAIVAAASSPREAAATLVAAAVAAGGHDNVTAIVVRSSPARIADGDGCGGDELDVSTVPRRTLR